MTRVAGDVAINVSADVGPLVTNMGKGEASVDRFGDTANRVKGKLDRLGDTTRRFGSQMRATTRSTGSFGRGVQNAAFQVGDFAVQVGGGVDASRALAQQLPQLLGGFGMLGAVLGAAVAIIIPLRTAMQGLSEDGQDVTRVFGTLEPVAKNVAAAMKTMGEVALDGAELVVNNIDRILTIGATAAAFFAGRWVASMVAARVATFSLATSLVALRTALIRTGIGAVIIGAGELVFQFTRLMKAAGGFGNAMSLVGDVGAEAFDRIRRLTALLPEAFSAAALMLEGSFRSAFASVISAFADLTQAIATGFNQLFGTNLQGIGAGLAADIQASADALNEAGSEIFSSLGVSASQILSEPFESLQRIRDLIASMKEDNITLDSIFGNLGGDDESGGGKSLEEKLTEQEKRIQEHYARIKAIASGSLSDQLGGWEGYFSSLQGLTQSNNDKLLRVAKAFGAAQALIDAWRAHNAVLADPTLPWWARIASAGQVLAAGIGAVSAIRSVNAGGGAAGAAAGASAGSAASLPNTSPRVALTLTGSEGAMFSKDQVRDLINAINEEVEGGAIVRLA